MLIRILFLEKSRLNAQLHEAVKFSSHKGAPSLQDHYCTQLNAQK
jgi:hypothetical protein